MTVSAHIDALFDKHSQLEAAIEAERNRPMPDFEAMTELKKRKLLIKEEINELSQEPERKNA